MSPRARRFGLGVLALAAFAGGSFAVYDAGAPSSPATSRALTVSEGRDDSTVVVAAPETEPESAHVAPAPRAAKKKARRSSRHAPVLAPLPALPPPRPTIDTTTNAATFPMLVHNAAVVPPM